MEPKEMFKTLIGAYYGICELDEYPLKEYIMHDLKIYIEKYIQTNPIIDLDYQKTSENLEKELTLKSKLQDCLIILPKLNVSMEVLYLIKKKIREI